MSCVRMPRSSLGIADDLAEALVRRNETAIELALGDTCCRLRDDGAKSLLAFAQRPLGPDTFRRLADDAEDAQRLAVRIVNRRIGNIEVNRFGIAVALDVERSVLGGDRLAIVKNGLQKRFEIIPELGPVFARGTAKGLGCLSPIVGA